MRIQSHGFADGVCIENPPFTAIFLGVPTLKGKATCKGGCGLLYQCVFGNGYAGIGTKSAIVKGNGAILHFPDSVQVEVSLQRNLLRRHVRSAGAVRRGVPLQEVEGVSKRILQDVDQGALGISHTRHRTTTTVCVVGHGIESDALVCPNCIQIQIFGHHQQLTWIIGNAATVCGGVPTDEHLACIGETVSGNMYLRAVLVLILLHRAGAAVGVISNCPSIGIYNSAFPNSVESHVAARGQLVGRLVGLAGAVGLGVPLYKVAVCGKGATLHRDGITLVAGGILHGARTTVGVVAHRPHLGAC